MTARTSTPASTRDRILDAALQTFANQGFKGATTKEMARRAKVNEVTIFRLFKSKKALFAAVVTERSPVIPIVQSVSMEPRTSLEEMLRGNVRTVLSTLRKNKDLYMVMVGDAWRQPKLRSVAYEASVKRGITLVATMLQGLMDAGRVRRMDPEIAARALMGTVQFYFLTTDLMGDGAPKPEEEDRVIRGLVSIFLDGMKPGQGGGHG